jgi:hypothetical protein
MLRVSHLSGFGRIVPAVGGGGDSDVAAFISATGISDGTIESALEALVTSLKADGIWTKCIAIYPFVGGSSSTHSYNLKNTAAYQISWSGTVTHNSNGITGDGSTGYGNTGIQASGGALSVHSTHLSVYSGTNPGSDQNMWEIGSSENGVSWLALRLRYGSSQLSSLMYSTSSTSVNPSPPGDRSGFWIGSRRANNDHELYHNGASFDTNTTTESVAVLPVRNIYISALSWAGPSAIEHSDRNLRFASVGAGLTDTEAADFHTAVETFQDALSRGVV